MCRAPVLLVIATVVLGPLVLTAAPTPPSATARAWLEGDRLRVSRRVMFRPGELQVTQESRPVLDAMAVALRELPPDMIVVIEGHSDAGGDETENVLLSRARAEYVITSLVRRGLDPSKMRAEGMGSSRPLVPANHPEQYRNRRIEVYVLPMSAAHIAPAASNLPLIGLLDDDPPPPLVPLLDDGDAPVLLAASPRIPLLVDDFDVDLMPLPVQAAMAMPAPRIPLLDDAAPMQIGLVD